MICVPVGINSTINFFAVGITGADVNFILEVGKRLDTFAVDVGVIDFGGGDEVDDAVFVSPVNEDILNLLRFFRNY